MDIVRHFMFCVNRMFSCVASQHAYVTHKEVRAIQKFEGPFNVPMDCDHCLI